MKVFFGTSQTSRSFTDSEKRFILKILNDSRSWTSPRHWSESKVKQNSDWAVQLESQDFIDSFPGMKGLSVTFMNEMPRISLLSYENWTNVPQALAGTYDLKTYRTYLVNHELGHGLGLPHIMSRDAKRFHEAPVMIQQTKGLQGYARNVWPRKDERETLYQSNF
jgi:hypothetical protein